MLTIEEIAPIHEQITFKFRSELHRVYAEFFRTNQSGWQNKEALRESNDRANHFVTITSDHSFDFKSWVVAEIQVRKPPRGRIEAYESEDSRVFQINGKCILGSSNVPNKWRCNIDRRQQPHCRRCVLYELNKTPQYDTEEFANMLNQAASANHSGDTWSAPDGGHLNSLAGDWIRCQRRSEQWRHGCSMYGSPSDISWAIESPSGSTAQETAASLAEALADHPSVGPFVKFNLDTESYAKCRKDNAPVAPVNLTAEGATIAQIGANSGRFHQYRVHYELIQEGTAVALKTSFALADPSPSEGLAGKVPAGCGLNLSEVHLGFDFAAVATALEDLRLEADAHAQTVSSTMIAHGLLVDSTNGSLCVAGRIAEALRSHFSRMQGRKVEWSDLPQTHSNTIGRAAAIAVGADDAKEGWRDFLSRPEYYSPDARCHAVGVNFSPNRTAFENHPAAIRAQGQANADAFARSIARHRKLQRIGRALVAASKDDATGPQNAWVDSPVGAELVAYKDEVSTK